jgi:hypothetical protein
MSRNSTGWSAGAATVAFPIDAGTPMEGYAARSGAACGTHDELEISALVLCEANRRLVIVAADVAAVDAELVEEVASGAGVDRANLVICASHTHSGPAGVVPRLHPAEPDKLLPALRARFVAACVVVISTALERMGPATLMFSRQPAPGFAANRNDMHGPVDSRVSVLSVRNVSGELAAILVHFGCHPTVLSADNLFISSDFPGAMRTALRGSLEQKGHRPVILFANGAAGDVSTRYTRRGQDFREVGRVGEGLAAAALRALNTSDPIKGSIRYGLQRLSLTPRSLDLGVLPDEDAACGVDTAERRRAETRAQGAALLQLLADQGAGHVARVVDIEAWIIGELALVAVPGELFASLGSRVESVTGPATLVLGYANGYVGYLADEDAYTAATYEVLASPYAPGTGETVASAASQLVSRLRESSVMVD